MQAQHFDGCALDERSAAEGDRDRHPRISAAGSGSNSYHDKGRFVASSSEEDLAQQCTENLEIERVASVEC